jgi:hypothetical protein
MSTRRFTPQRIADLQKLIDSMPNNVVFSCGGGVKSTLVELLNEAVALDRALDEKSAECRAQARLINNKIRELNVCRKGTPEEPAK